MNTQKNRSKGGNPIPRTYVEETIMNFEGEQVKQALKHLENIKRFTRDVQDGAIHYDTHKNVITGLTEIVLRLDLAIDDLKGVQLSDDDGIQLEVI